MTPPADAALPVAASSLVCHALNALQGQTPATQIAALLAATAWLIDQHHAEPARAEMVVQAQHRLAAQAHLLRQQVRGRA